ncbi:conserved hypothetical protein [Trichinella spiralis]|uniref:hypothetical protein n=1 Tax=Trichinella spiralis TaxID=6334 RepID=UPI0001EFEB9F|nr:conserved hypothetical protein [Trichinella spiralis]
MYNYTSLHGFRGLPKRHTRGCSSSLDSFCHICGSFVVKSKRHKIADFVKKAYFEYFGIKLGDQDKSWAKHINCHTFCVNGIAEHVMNTGKKTGHYESKEPESKEFSMKV